MWPALSIAVLVSFSETVPAAWLTGMNAYLVGLAAVLAIAAGRAFDEALIRVLVPFGGLLLLGGVSGIGSDSWDFLRDFWYVGNAALTFAAGYVLYCANPNVRYGLRATVMAGSVVGVLQIAPFIADPALITYSSTQIRSAIGTGFFVPALGLIVLSAFVGRCSDELGIHPVFAAAAAGLMTAAIILSFSRTILLVAVVGAVVGFGFLDRRVVSRSILMSLLGLIALSLLGVMIDAETPSGQHSFIGKLARSLQELWVADYADFKSINENWRGYETARALLQYASGSPLEWLIGQGFGVMIDLGVAIELGGSRGIGLILYREIPILHNGYAYLLVKCGLLGVAAFFAFLVLLYRSARTVSTANWPATGVSASRLMRAIVVSLLATTWVISGPFNKSELFGFMLVAGFTYAHLVRAHWGILTGVRGRA
jgi:hypothetical protein